MAKKNAAKPAQPTKAAKPKAAPKTTPEKAETKKVAAKGLVTPKLAAPKPTAPKPAPRAEKPEPAEKSEKSGGEAEKLRAELVKVRAELKTLDGERRRLTTVAEKTERALADEAARRSALEKRLEAAARTAASAVPSQGGDYAALQAKVSELKLHLEAAAGERDDLRQKLSKAGTAADAAERLTKERDVLAKRVQELEIKTAKPPQELVDELRRKAEANAETKVRALTNERDGLRSRIKELETTSPEAADKARMERLEEKLMELSIERDNYRERLTEAESQASNAPSSEVVDRMKTSLADAERDVHRYREKVIDLEAQVLAIRGGIPSGHHGGGRVNVIELQSRLDESEREREKAEKERDDLEKRVHALKTDLYTRKNTPDSGNKRFCPGCSTEMRGVVQSSVHMDVCPQCSGLYLGKGDVAAIMAQEREVVKEAAKGSFFGRIFGKP